MKKLALTLLLSVLVSASLKAGSGEVTIIGNSHGFKTGELFISAESKHIVKIENNKFKITIPLKTNPQRINLYALKLKKFLTFYAENGVIYAEVFKNGFLNKSHFSGSASQEIMNNFENAIRADNKEKFYELLSLNINTLPGVDYLTRYRRNLTVDKVRDLYSMINEPLKENAKDIKAYLDTVQIETMEKGTKAFNFRWQQGKQTLSLSDFEGKYVLLNFTSTACGPCWKTYEEMDELEALHGNNIKVISFHTDNGKEVWYNIAKQKNIDFNCTSLWEVHEKEKALEVYNINILPTFLLLNKDGIIIDRWSGSLNTKKILTQIK
ncbi:MAG: redoxin domain-containing protein [Tissierellales bacterium]|nr:redoxin domain-containing protein [Tissierellales bacterium]